VVGRGEVLAAACGGGCGVRAFVKHSACTRKFGRKRECVSTAHVSPKNRSHHGGGGCAHPRALSRVNTSHTCTATVTSSTHRHELAYVAQINAIHEAAQGRVSGAQQADQHHPRTTAEALA
jgi:hypothetical protein